MREEIKLLKEFESKFGFTAYEELKSIMARMYERISELEHSRDKWKEKCNNCKSKSS